MPALAKETEPFPSVPCLLPYYNVLVKLICQVKRLTRGTVGYLIRGRLRLKHLTSGRGGYSGTTHMQNQGLNDASTFSIHISFDS